MSGFEFIEDNKTNLISSGSSSKKKSHIKSKLPWIEKYRPKKIDDIVSQEKVVQSLKISLESNNLPHLLFYGPPGTGKTSTILAIGRELFGIELMKDRVIELNASDDRGINAVREKIKVYAMNAISDAAEYKERTGNKYPCPPYKIIVLDEADSMTKDAQSALRKIMENYSHITRFCFICNYINKIIESIASRCAQYGFLPLNKELMHQKLGYIAECEKISYTDEIIDKIVGISEGDMRKAIMMLQHLKYMQKKYNIENTIDKISEMNGYIPEKYIEEILYSLKNKTFDENLISVRDIIASGYSVDYFLEQFFKILIEDKELLDEVKCKICLHFSDNQKKIIDGADEYLQLLDMVMYSFMVISKKI